MEPASDKSDKKSPRLTRRERFVWLGILIALFAVLMLQRTTLVDPIDYRLKYLSGAGFFALGAWWSAKLSRLDNGQSNWKRVLILGAMPLFAIFVGTYLARVTVASVAFAGVNTPFFPIEARVTDFRTGKYGGHFATVLIEPATREFETKISSELYQNLNVWRHPGRDCIALGVQKGRGGIRRTMLPNLLFDAPMGLDKYRVCGASAT